MAETVFSGGVAVIGDFQLDAIVRRMQFPDGALPAVADWTLTFAEQVKKTGALFLEAPFTGSKLAAEQRRTDDIYFAALGRNLAHSGLADLKEPKLRAKDYTPQFSLKHMGKDLRLALETAHRFSLPLEQTARLKESYDQGIAAGWKEDDFIGLVRLLEKS